MALARVQATPKATHATAAACTFSSQPTIGNGIVVGILIGGTPVPTVADNRGNTYTLAKKQDGAIGSEAVAIYYCSKITATGTPFTVTASTGVSAALVAVAVEVSGVDNGLAIDLVYGSNGISSLPNAQTFSPTRANIFSFALTAISATQSSLTTGVGPGLPSPGWTEEAEQLIQSPSEAGEIDSRVLTNATSGSSYIEWTASTTGWWATASVAFYATPIPPTIEIRTSQDVVEIISLPNPEARVSQDIVEVISLPFPQARVSQHVIEIISANVAPILSAEKVQFILLG